MISKRMVDKFDKTQFLALHRLGCVLQVVKITQLHTNTQKYTNATVQRARPRLRGTRNYYLEQKYGNRCFERYFRLE